MGGKIKGKSGFVIKKLQNKHDYKQTKKSINVTSKWITEKIKSKVDVAPHVKSYVLHEFMQETFGVRIENLKLYKAKERPRTDIHGDHIMGL